MYNRPRIPAVPLVLLTLTGSREQEDWSQARKTNYFENHAKNILVFLNSLLNDSAETLFFFEALFSSYVVFFFFFFFLVLLNDTVT